jgi:hypothetical protein
MSQNKPAIENQSRESVILPRTRDEHGNIIYRSTMNRTENLQDKILLCKRGPVVPVIFIPGIMGTNLMNTESKEVVWAAPNTDGLFLFANAAFKTLFAVFKSPESRQSELDSRPGKVSVYHGGEIGGEGLSSEEKVSDEVLRHRGWGSIMRSAYHPIMVDIQNYMNSIMSDHKLQPWWDEKAEHQPSDWGDWENNPPLSELDPAQGLAHAADIHYEVWAAGYNWLQSNAVSALDVINYINKVVLPHYKGRAKKVLIVTHSMGGLVARAMVACHGFDKLYGIVHGAMPATGAPATYKRIRSGFEGSPKQILGRHAGDTVATMAFAQGPLELLPTQDYNAGQPWLFVRDTSTGKKVLSLPQSDPYEEIYKSEKWWGLIPESNHKLMDPAGLIEVFESNELGNVPTTKLSIYHELIDNVKTFHAQIQAQYYKETYVHYAAEAKNMDLSTWGGLEWRGYDLHKVDLLNARLTGDDLKSNIELNNSHSLTFGPVSYPGDGTVPVFSAVAPRGCVGVKGAFAHGCNSGPFNTYCKEGAYNKTSGYAHQEAYADPDKRTLYATLYGLVRLSAHVPIASPGGE